MRAKQVLVRAFTCLLIGISIVFQSWLAAADESGAADNVQKMIDKWKTGESDILFYGKIVDQTGMPVSGVTVEVDVPEQTGFMKTAPRKQKIVSDENGYFEVTAKTYGRGQLKGSFLSIENITKAGFEYIRGTDPNMDFCYRDEYTYRHVPKKDQPVVFHIRRKEEKSSFLLEKMYLEYKIQTIETGQTIGFDFVRSHRIKDTRNLVYDGESVFSDLQVKATFNMNDATWSVVLSPGDTNGGIVVSDQLLYEAPEGGYQPEYTFTPQDHKTPQAKYFYIRSRDPAIYSRYEIEYINANKDFFRLSGKSVTNPYGDRNLEQATDLPYEITRQLTDETKDAFLKNKRPDKPDIQKLTNEAKERVDKNMRRP